MSFNELSDLSSIHLAYFNLFYKPIKINILLFNSLI